MGELGTPLNMVMAPCGEFIIFVGMLERFKTKIVSQHGRGKGHTLHTHPAHLGWMIGLCAVLVGATWTLEST